MFGPKFDVAKLKPRLKMACHRLQIATNKKSALMKQQKREIALLLAEEPLPKEEKARIRAEALIRDDNTIEAYEILQLECELVFERIKLLSSQKDCPTDMASCISTIIYASDRVDISELMDIRKQFRAKYGKEFEQAALANTNGILNERVVAKLSVHPPTAILVNAYLEKIAEEFEVDWKAKPLQWDDQMKPMVAPYGSSVGVAAGSGLGRYNDLHQATTGISQVSIMGPSLTTKNRSNNDDDDDDNHDGGSSSRGGSGGGGGGFGSGTGVDRDIPVGRVPSAIPATVRVDSQDKPDYGGIPIVTATSYHPPDVSNASAPSERNLQSNDDGSNHIKLFMPVPVPYNKQSSSNNDDSAGYADGTSTIATSEYRDDNMETNKNNNTESSSDLDSLTARFAKLKR